MLTVVAGGGAGGRGRGRAAGRRRAARVAGTGVIGAAGAGMTAGGRLRRSRLVSSCGRGKVVTPPGCMAAWQPSRSPPALSRLTALHGPCGVGPHGRERLGQLLPGAELDELGACLGGGEG